MKKKEVLVLYLYLLCYYVIKKKKRNKRWINRRWHVRPINRLRRQYGQYDNLFQELKKDDNVISLCKNMQRKF